MPSADELHQRGVRALVRGQHARAREVLSKAAEATDDQDLLARIDASLAYAYALTDQVPTALDICARAAARPGLSPNSAGVVAAQRALILVRAGETVASLGAFAEAVSLLTDEQELGKAYVNRGNVHLQQGRPLLAARDFEAGANHLRDAGLVVDAAMARHNLGYAQLLAGDLVGALREMASAYQVLGEVSPVVRAVCAQDRAEALMAAGLVDEARTALRDAAAAFGSRRMRQPQGEAELVLARGLVLDAPERARSTARSASRHFARAGSDSWRARADAVALTAEVALGRTSASLLDDGAELQAALRREGLDPEARQLALVLARVEARRREPDTSRARLRTLRIGPRDPLAVRLLAADVRSDVEAASGRPRAALGVLRRGLDDLHTWQSSFGSLDLQTNVVGHGVRLAKRGLELAVASGSPAVLFEWSERARMLASRVQPVQAPPDEQLAAALGELRQGPEPGREAELRRHIREQAWQQRGSGQVTDPLSLAEMQAEIGGSALVAYVVTDDRVVALVVTAERAVRHDLAPRAALAPLLSGLLADLDMAAAELAGPMAGAIRRGLAARLAGLSELLVAPLRAELGERPVVLTPSGVLAGVPWTLLQGYAGRPVTVAQSASSWVARRATPLRVGNAGFVAGPRVARAEDEVVAAAKEWEDARLVTGAGARTSAVSELAQEVDVLHVAAHGRHSAENPLFSGLELVDGPWYGYDIDGLEHVPDVVILSACEVGRSAVRWGEELIGMSTAWLHAGARCVVASAAAVNDEAAYDALLALHEALAAGAEPAAALASALRRRRPDDAPAPFVCFG